MARAYLGRYSTSDNSRVAEIQAAHDKLFSEPPRMVALDIESPSTTDDRPLGIGISNFQGDAFYYDIFDASLPWHLVWPSATTKVWQNGTFDLQPSALGKFGADIENIEDTILLARLAGIPASLVDCCEYLQTQHRPENMGTVLRRHGVKKVTELPWEVVAQKCMTDVLGTAESFDIMYPQRHQERYGVEISITRLLLSMSKIGLKIDQDRLAAIDAELEQNEKLYIGTAKSFGFNPLSPSEVAFSLMDEGEWVPFKNGRPNTEADVLEQMSHPWAALTLLARKYNKLHSTYSHKFLGQDRAHSRFSISASTLRIASADVNLQNIPTGGRRGDIIPKAGRIRSIFVPDEDVFTIADMGQIELRVLAHLSGDLVMQDILNDRTRTKANDIHGLTVARWNLPRVAAKNLNFGMAYGGDLPALSKPTGIKDFAMLAAFREDWFTQYQFVRRWIEDQQYIGLRDLEVETLFGQKLKLLQGHQDRGNISEKHIKNMAVNFPIQGSAAEIFKRALLEIIKHVPVEQLLLQVHDEIMMNGRHVLDWDEMSHMFDFWTPWEIDNPTRWEKD